MTSPLEPQPVGCGVVAIGINAVLMGLVALGFTQGPYSSFDQELWYRYGSLGFVFVGVLLPVAALALGARRSAVALTGVVIWAIAALLAFLFYAFISSSGV